MNCTLKQVNNDDDDNNNNNNTQGTGFDFGKVIISLSVKYKSVIALSYFFYQDIR
jgi:hypothetical protein